MDCVLVWTIFRSLASDATESTSFANRAFILPAVVGLGNVDEEPIMRGVETERGCAILFVGLMMV